MSDTFGSAPVFLVVDTESRAIASVVNRDQHHTHGACNPMRALDDQRVDAVVVGGIGAGALGKLNQLGITVLRSSGGDDPGEHRERRRAEPPRADPPGLLRRPRPGRWLRPLTGRRETGSGARLSGVTALKVLANPPGNERPVQQLRRLTAGVLLVLITFAAYLPRAARRAGLRLDAAVTSA